MAKKTRRIAEKEVRSVLDSVAKLNARDYSNYLDDFSPHFKFHAAMLPHPLDREQSLEYMKKFVETFPGVQLTVDQIFPSPDASSLVYRFTAKADGTNGFMGHSPTHEPIEFHGATFYNFKEGLRVDSWNLWDNADILRQIGVLTSSLNDRSASNSQSELPPALQSEGLFADEEMILGYALETAQVKQDRSTTYMVAEGPIFNLDGQPVGQYKGLLRVLGSLDLDQLEQQTAMRRIPAADKPEDIPGVPLFGSSLSTLSFNEADSITVIGAGTTNVVRLENGSTSFMFSDMGYVAGGTGQYQGASGVEMLFGNSVIPQGVTVKPGSKLHLKTFFGIRFVRQPAEKAGTSPSGGTSETRPQKSSATGGSSLHPTIPPGADPDTYKLQIVQPLLRRIANFTFFSMPNSEQPNVPIMSDGQLIGVEVHENLHRFEIKQRLTGSGFEIKNAVGQPTAQVHMHWRPIPDDFVARPGVQIPPTPLDPTRSQRFMMHDGHFSLDDSGGSGLRGFGSGRTFPVMVDGKPQLRLAAVVDALEGLGKVAGHQGLLVVNGYIEPPDGLALCILLRLTDPSGDFAVKSRLPALRPIPHPDPDNLYLIFLGEAVPGRPVEMIHGPGGQMLGARGPQRMRLIDIVYDVKGSHGIRSKSAIGEIVGEMNADAWFDPFSGSPPFPFQTTGGTFTFFGRDGQTIGAVAANMVEGRALPTEMPGAPMPVFRVGGLAPVTSGSGCFRHAIGLFTIDSFISLVPNTMSGLFVMHLSDPRGTLRTALANAWR